MALDHLADVGGDAVLEVERAGGATWEEERRSTVAWGERWESLDGAKRARRRWGSHVQSRE